MGRSLQKVTSNRTDLKSINHLISIQSITYKTKRQSMTKNALSISTLVVVSLILNSSTTKYTFVSATPQSEKPVESEVNKDAGSIKASTTESPCIRYCPGDGESDGGKSIAFLRLGRSSEETENNTEDKIRQEINDAIEESKGSSGIHNLAKRSSSAEDENQSLSKNPQSNLEEQDAADPLEDEIDTDTLEDPSNAAYDEDAEEKEQFEYVPYEDFEIANLPEIENEDVFIPKVFYPSSSDFYNVYGKRSSFSLRPMKKSNFAFRPMKKSNFAFRPMKKNNFAFRPMKKSNFAFRPMKKSNFEFRPMKRGNFDFRPMKKGNFDFRPMKKTNFDFRPMKRSNFAFRPMRRSNFAFRPMKKSNFDFRPMKRSNFAFRPMKKLSDSFSFRPVKRSFQFRPMKRGQMSKDSFLRYGKRDSFALRPMKRPEDSFVLRPMKKDADFDGSLMDHLYLPSGKRSSFSLRPMKKDMTGFQFRPMKRYSEDSDALRLGTYGVPIDNAHDIEDYNGINALLKR